MTSTSVSEMYTVKFIISLETITDCKYVIWSRADNLSHAFVLLLSPLRLYKKFVNYQSPYVIWSN